MLCFQVAGSMHCWGVSLIQVLGSVMLAASHCQGKLLGVSIACWL